MILSEKEPHKGLGNFWGNTAITWIAMSLIVTNSVAISAQIPQTGNKGVAAKGRAPSFEETLALMNGQSSQTMQRVTGQQLVENQLIQGVKASAANHSSSAANPNLTVAAPTSVERNGAIREQMEKLEAQWSSAGSLATRVNGQTDPAEFLKLQGQMYQVEERLSVFSKVVDQGTSGVKQILQMQI